MRAYKIFPLRQIKSANLSKAALARLYWFDWFKAHHKNISLTCRHFGISRDTFYHWKKNFKPYNLQTLEDNTANRKPHKLRQMTTDPAILKRIYDIRLSDREKSKYEIQEELKREGVTVGRSAIQKVINRHPELLNTQHIKKLRGHTGSLLLPGSEPVARCERDIQEHLCRLTPNISMFWVSGYICFVQSTVKAGTDMSGATRPLPQPRLLTFCKG